MSGGNKKKPVLLSCPCCGNKDLYLGHESFDTVAVVCWAHGGGCGLRMSADIFSGLKKGITGMTKLEHYALRLAVKRWNRRKT